MTEREGRMSVIHIQLDPKLLWNWHLRMWDSGVSYSWVSVHYPSHRLIRSRPSLASVISNHFTSNVFTFKHGRLTFMMWKQTSGIGASKYFLFNFEQMLECDPMGLSYQDRTEYSIINYLKNITSLKPFYSISVMFCDQQSTDANNDLFPQLIRTN